MYSVHQLSSLAGVSVRTLHYYDKLGLLKPSVRTEARYRMYGEKELLRLQQILFYKELDFPLAQIADLLDDPEFNMVKALENHKEQLAMRREQITVLLTTIDKTISKLKGEKDMVSDKDLYAGFTKEQAEAYRQEAINKYGIDEVEASEKELRAMSKADFMQLKIDMENILSKLKRLMHLPVDAKEVQEQIGLHYKNIRLFWGEALCKSKNMKEAYKGLAQLYADDLRYTSVDGKTDPEYALFMQKAMNHYAEVMIQ